MVNYRELVDDKQGVYNALFEVEVLKINNPILDYHVCELYARLCWEEEGNRFFRNISSRNIFTFI